VSKRKGTVWKKACMFDARIQNHARSLCCAKGRRRRMEARSPEEGEAELESELILLPQQFPMAAAADQARSARQQTDQIPPNLPIYRRQAGEVELVRRAELKLRPLPPGPRKLDIYSSTSSAFLRPLGRPITGRSSWQG
jgi:hypothetical protein